MKSVLVSGHRTNTHKTSLTTHNCTDVQLDDKGIQAVMDLRSKLGDNPQKLTDPSKYVDKRYWQKAMQP
jgi:hypothetical protein